MEATQGMKPGGVELLADYERDGYAIARGVVGSELVEEARGHITWLMARHPELRPEQLGHQLVADDPFWVRLISDPRLLDVAGLFVGPDIALFASHYICKPPHSGQAVLWHQDGSYWPLEPMRVVTLWLALDDVDPENGCMRVIPGTQHDQLAALVERADGKNVLGSGMAEGAVDESAAVNIVMAPGDVEVHHPNIVHGSNANASARWRRGLTIRYIPTSTRITQPAWPCAFLLRGKAVVGVNDYVAWPRYEAGRHYPFAGCEGWIS